MSEPAGSTSEPGRVDAVRSSEGGAGFDITELSGFDLAEELGRGARSVVYRARRRGTDYAVKVLTPPTDEQQSVAFRREAALLACLDQPGAARVHEVGEVAGRPYLIMDLLEGRTLADVLRDDGPLKPVRAASIRAQVAGALAAAHRAGLVHRDVKRDNIMVSSAGRVSLVDFGLAARTGAAADGVAAGTFLYSAPEQTGMLRRPVDARADLYALGAVLFEGVTGAPPYAAADPGELIRLHLAAPVPDVRQARPDVPMSLAAVIGTLLAKDPDDRYQSAAGLGRDLERIEAGEVERFALSLAAPPGDWTDGPLIGREPEVEQLRTRWRQAVAGRGGAVLVQGAPGAGKSRLGRETAAAARMGGHPVLRGKCAAESAAPLAPLRAAIENYLHEAVGSKPLTAEATRRKVRAAAGSAAGLLAGLSPTLTTLLDPDR